MKTIKDPELYVALSKVEDLLEGEGWIKGNLRSHEGHCIQGAIDAVCWGQVGQQDLWERMHRAVIMALPDGAPMGSISTFNDSFRTSFADVQEVLRKARESAL